MSLLVWFLAFPATEWIGTGTETGTSFLTGNGTGKIENRMVWCGTGSNVAAGVVSGISNHRVEWYW